MTRLSLHEDRLFPADETTREVARRLYTEIKSLPIISPHGHTDPNWFADNANFSDPAELLITPDHYVFRMLYSQGVSLEDLGISPVTGTKGKFVKTDPEKIWNLLAKYYHLFRGTPSRMWLDWIFVNVFKLEDVLTPDTAAHYYKTINSSLAKDSFRPREMFDRFGIEVIATTEDPLDPLKSHAKLKSEGWGKKVITTFRPDNVVDPDYEGFSDNLDRLGAITGYDTTVFSGYLDALRNRREYFKGYGATATDHGHPTANSCDLSRNDSSALFDKIRTGKGTVEDAEVFRGQMLTEMARMSLDDGLVMQLHAGSIRNHNGLVFERFGRDKGADLPGKTDYVHGLKPLLNRFGNETDLTLILFTLDETVYSRELAPLAGHYPILKLGPPWWFHDSPEGMRRFREQTTETAGFYNTAGFNDDTRAFFSIPARHDVARRMDCGYLAQLVVEHRLPEDEALEVAKDLTYNLAKAAYKL